MPKDLKEQALLYEVPALYWIDLSTDEKGLAIISFQKHGYTILGNRIGLTLLKSPIIPNTYSDIGKYRITYYIYPHRGNTWQSNVPAKMVELWSPLKVIETK
jgi:alpha-mannosidase